MAGIYIKGMAMPENCGVCRFAVDGWCYAYGKPNIDALSNNGRANWCPAFFVPDHGRLGDLDRILEIIDGIWDCNDMVFKPNDHCCDVPKDCHGCKWAETKRAIREIVANTHTIIPADKEEE